MLYNTIYGTTISQIKLDQALEILNKNEDIKDNLGIILKDKNDYSHDKLSYIERAYLNDKDNFDLKKASLEFDKKLYDIMLNEFNEMKLNINDNKHPSF
jgi:hypothetical protein